MTDAAVVLGLCGAIASTYLLFDKRVRRIERAIARRRSETPPEDTPTDTIEHDAQSASAGDKPERRAS